MAGSEMGNNFSEKQTASRRTKLTEWAAEHAETLGHSYASELSRRR